MRARFLAAAALPMMIATAAAARPAAPVQSQAALSPETIARLEKAADTLEIERLIADYSWYLDTKNYDAYGALFAHGAFLGPQGQVVACGAQQVASLTRSYLEPIKDIVIRHVVTNTRIDVATDGRTATAESFLTTIQAPTNTPAYIYRMSYYRDHFRKADGRWEFASRQEDTIWVKEERKAQGAAVAGAATTSSPAPRSETCKP